jgi:hypothetical protein
MVEDPEVIGVLDFSIPIWKVSYLKYGDNSAQDFGINIASRLMRGRPPKISPG